MKKIFLGIFLFFLLFSLSASASGYSFLNNSGIKEVAGGTGHSGISGNSFFSAGKTPQELIGGIIGVALSLIGIIFMCYIFYAGWIWMNARGNAKDTDKAVETIKNSIIGIILVLFAYAITAFVGNYLTQQQQQTLNPGTGNAINQGAKVK